MEVINDYLRLADSSHFCGHPDISANAFVLGFVICGVRGPAGRSGSHPGPATVLLCPSGGPRVRFLTRCDGEVSEPLVGRQGSRVSMRVARGARHCSRVMVGESGLETC